jgi:AcrR family transcriptional regulator
MKPNSDAALGNLSKDLDLKRHRSMPKADQSRQMRERLIESALELLIEVGFFRTSLKLVAERAGVSRGPLHYHFKDKNELFGEVARRIPTTISDETRKRLNEARELEERILTVVDIAGEQHAGEHHIAIFELLVAARTDPDLAAKVLPPLLSGEQVADDRWADYLKDTQISGETADAFRTLLVAYARGLAFDRLENEDSEKRKASIALMRSLIIAWMKEKAYTE